jgi:uncharacterized protein (DUF885 family)
MVTDGEILQAVAEDFFSGYFARNPVEATLLGDHAHDGEWPDLSPAGREAYAKWVTDVLARVDAVPRETLSLDDSIDLDVLRDRLLREQLSNDVERPWRTSPLAYAYLIGGGLDGLIDRDFAPLAQRAGHLAQRLEGLPGLVQQAVANLDDPAIVKRPHAKVAVSQLAGIRLLIESEIPKQTQGAPKAVTDRIAAATPKAVDAVADLERHIGETLLPKASGEWRLGRKAFSRKLRLTLQTDLSADEVYRMAVEEHARVREKMAKLARELYVPLFGQKKLDKLEAGADSEVATRMIREVLAALADDHVDPDALRDAAEETLARLESFVKEAKIVSLDDREVLEVIWTPPHERGVAIAGLDPPPPLDADRPGLPSFYVVQPVPKDWPAARRRSFLREYNRFMLEILSIHEAIPGHFVQLYYGKREPSKIRKVFDNGPFVEGWAVYMERVMVESGYAGKQPEGKRPSGISKGLWKVKTSPALRAKAIALHGQKFYLRAVTNAILDHDIHAGVMKEEDAVRLMVDQAFQEEGEARAKWVRAQVSSTQLSTYFVGAVAWFRLREQAEARARKRGGAFDLAGFHSEALGHGAPPVHRLPELMGR